MKPRVQWIDVAKGIAMLGIIAGHLANPRICSIVFTFHVPLFYFVSGYFLDLNLNMSDFLKKKVRALLVPYLFTCVLVCTLSVPLNMLQGNDWKKLLGEWMFASVYGAGNTFTEPFFIPQIGAVWFLLALFWSEIMMRLLVQVKKGTRICLVLVIFGLSIWSAPYIWLPFSVQAGGCALLFVYLGHLGRQIQPHISRLLAVSPEVNFVLGLVFVANWIGAVRRYEGFSLARAIFSNGVLDLWGAVCGTIVVLIFAKILSEKSACVANGLAFVGRYSLLILFVHVLELNLLPWEKIFGVFQEWFKLSGDMFVSFVVTGKVIFIFALCCVAMQIPQVMTLFGYRKRGVTNDKNR